MLAVLTAGADGSIRAVSVARRSPKNRIASVTLRFAESGRCGEASESDKIPTTAATSGHGFPQSAGSRCWSTCEAAATYTGSIFLSAGTYSGWYEPSSFPLPLLAGGGCSAGDWDGGSITPAASNPEVWTAGTSDEVANIPAAWKLD